MIKSINEWKIKNINLISEDIENEEEDEVTLEKNIDGWLLTCSYGMLRVTKKIENITLMAYYKYLYKPNGVDTFNGINTVEDIKNFNWSTRSWG